MYGVACVNSSASNENLEFQLGDGLAANKIIWNSRLVGSATDIQVNLPYDFTVFINSGEFLQIVGSTTSRSEGTVRQVADVQGNIVNPSGFTPQ